MDPAEWLASVVPGAPADQLRLVLCTLLSYPLGVAFRKVTDVNARHVFSLVVGLLFGIYCFGLVEMFHPLFVSTVTYGLIHVVPKQAHTIVFAFAFGYLCIGHIYRMYTDYMSWTMDYTAAQMIVTLKCIQIAFNVHDADVAPELLHKDELEDRVKKVPGVLEYYAHIFFFPTFLVGPNFTFNMYNNFIHRKETPAAVVPTLMKLLQAVVCYCFVFASGFMPVTAATKPEFRVHPYWWRIIYIWVSVVCYRFKYYFIWSLCEGAATSAGMSYNGKAKTAPTLGERISGDVDADGNRWDLVKAVKITGVELAPNVKSITDYWNMTVARFLRVYVYSRLTRPNQGKPGNFNVYVTQFVSAAWHGFYPGYYMFFVSTSGVVATARLARGLLRPIFAERYPQLKPLYDVLTWLATVWVLNVLGAAFIVLDFWAGWTLWRNVWFFSHVMSMLGYVLLTVLRPQLRRLGPRKEAAPKTA